MVASFPEEQEEAVTETLASLFTYGNYSIKLSPLNTGDTIRWFGFSSVLLNQ
jgi:hypothetical protein